MELDQLYRMDCVEGMKEIPAGTVDLAFADPPFNIGYDYDVYEDRRAADEYLDWTRDWGRALVNALKPTGTFWLAIGDDFAAELKLIFQRELGLTCRSWVIWYYTFGVNCKQKFSRSHTHLFHFVKNPKGFTFNVDAIKVPSARQLVYADSRAASAGRLPDDTWILRPQDMEGGFAPDENVWYFPRVCGTFKERAGFHGCQMPEQLLSRIIKASSNVGELVLEPFGGSGTTLHVAKKLGRHFLGFEISKKYARRIRERLNEIQHGEGLAGALDPKTSAPSTNKGKRLDGGRRTRSDTEAWSAVRSTRDDIRRGLIEAFVLVRDGWSVDRVVADPDFNASFLEKCRRLGLAGPDVELNRRLLALRKAKGLQGLTKSRRVVFPIPPFERDRIEYALEIAIQRFHKKGQSLDDVICDPETAGMFDTCVFSMIPKPYPSFAIRWLALSLRKRANFYRSAGAGLQKLDARPHDVDSPFNPTALAKAPEGPGLYWLSAPGRNLYVGSTINLRQRLGYQFTGTRFDFWGSPRGALQLAIQPFGMDLQRPIAQQSRWIKDWQPVGNYEDFAAAE